MHENQVKRVLESVKTKEELDILKRAVSFLEQALYKGKGEVEEVLNSELPRDLAASFREVITEAPYQGSVSKIADLLSDLKKTISRMRIFGLDLAFYPSEKSVTILYNWVRREAGESVVLDLNIDRGVIGGARLVFGGKYRDYSLGGMIEEAMEEERERILGMIQPKIAEETVKTKS